MAVGIYTGHIPNHLKNHSFPIDHHIQFLAYSLPEEKQLKVLLRGVHSSFSEELVKDKLSNLSFMVIYVRQFLKKRRELPMFMITLPNKHESKNIFQLQLLLYIIIWVEAYKTSVPAQCFACQGFGHSSSHCDHQSRCIEFGEEHLT